MRSAILILGSSGVSSAFLPAILDVSFRGSLLLFVAGVASLGLWRASAANRHALWAVAFAALLLLPILTLALPSWRVLPWSPGEAALASPAGRLATQSAGAIRPASDMVSTEPLAAATRIRPQPYLSDALGHHEPSPSKGTLATRAGTVSSRPALRWRLAILLTWLTGSAVLAGRMLASRFVLRRLAAESDCLTDGQLAATVDSLKARIGLATTVEVIVTPRRQVPMAWGVLRPKVLLPLEAMEWEASRLEAVLLHELGHIKRHDLLTHVLAQTVCVLYWFNPLVWVAAWRLSVERERACDDLVLQVGMKPSSYARELLAVVSRCDLPTPLLCTALGMARRRRLESRIVAILDKSTNRKSSTKPAACVTCCLAVAVTLAAATLHAQAPAPAEASAKADEPAQADKEAAADQENPLRNPAFESGTAGGPVVGWLVPKIPGYRATLTDANAKEGQQCGLLESEPDAKDLKFGNVMQGLDPAAYRGKRVRFRAAVRTAVEGKRNQAQLWFRVDRKDEQGKYAVGDFDNMSARPIKTAEWQYYEIVGDVAADATLLVVGCLLNGEGKVWFDDATVEVVGNDVAVTTTPPRTVDRSRLRNAGFEEGKVGGPVAQWMVYEPYKGELTDQNPKVGKQCASIELAEKTKPHQFGALNHWLDPTKYRGKRVRFRAAVRTDVEGEGNQAQLWFRVDRPGVNKQPVFGAFDNMQDRPITQAEWQYYEIVGDVADDAKGIVFGMLLVGQGKAWLDDVTFEVVGDDVATTARVPAGNSYELRNPDFEAGEAGGDIVGWGAPKSPGLESTLSDNTPKVGKLCARMQRKEKTGERAVGGILQGLHASSYRGKRIRYRAAVRAEVEGAGNQGHLWLRVDRQDAEGKRVPIAFDNMHDRPITTGEWEYYDVVADVAPDAQHITVGFLLIGLGEVWIDDTSVEVVGDDVQTTTRDL